MPENKQYEEQNRREPACLSGTKLNNTWVNTAEMAIDKPAPQEQWLLKCWGLPESSHAKYDEPHMFESEDMGRDLSYIPDVAVSHSHTSVICSAVCIVHSYTHLIWGINMSRDSQFSSLCF